MSTATGTDHGAVIRHRNGVLAVGLSHETACLLLHTLARVDVHPPGLALLVAALTEQVAITEKIADMEIQMEREHGPVNDSPEPDNYEPGNYGTGNYEQDILP